MGCDVSSAEGRGPAEGLKPGNKLQAKNPHNPDGDQIEVTISRGKLYSYVCLRCGAEIGGVVVGGESPYSSIDDVNTEWVSCVFCDDHEKIIVLREA